MAGEILRNWRILAATLFSAVLVVGAYVLARGIESPPVAQASEESALLQAIATRDSNGDGLPDWEKSLYGIPINATTTDYFSLGMTDGEAVAKGLIVPKAVADIPVATSSPDASAVVDPSLPPAPADGTLTATFAKNFFTFYLAATQANGGADLTDADMQNIADEALNSLSSAIVVAPDYKSDKDLTIAASGADALAAFAVSAEAVMTKNTSTATTSEIKYLSDAAQHNDTSALIHITSIATAYRDSAIGISVLPVPRELAAADLMLVNALMRMSQITTDFTRVNTDPLATILALKQYPQAVAALATAFSDIGGVYKAANITLPNNAPGASFVNLIENVAAEQKAAKKP